MTASCATIQARTSLTCSGVPFRASSREPGPRATTGDHEGPRGTTGDHGSGRPQETTGNYRGTTGDRRGHSLPSNRPPSPPHLPHLPRPSRPFRPVRPFRPSVPSVARCPRGGEWEPEVLSSEAINSSLSSSAPSSLLNGSTRQPN